MSHNANNSIENYGTGRRYSRNEEPTAESDPVTERPNFPKRAIVTAGMPYGNKELHLGHVGGVFVPADAYARFLRDRIGKENVIFISGTDCYGSPIVEYYRQITETGEFSGSIDEFVQFNHTRQDQVLQTYNISLNLFAGSSIRRPAEIHREVCATFINQLYANGYLQKLTTSQFYDVELGTFLNGRQVVGHCPIQGCASDRGYADECSLGHQYMPSDLINPNSTLSGKTPEMRDVVNWYFRLEDFRILLAQWLDHLKQLPCYREFVGSGIQEFLEPPAIYVKREHLDELELIHSSLPEFTLQSEDNKSSVRLVFSSLEDREKACRLLAQQTIRFRSGKTLVPFRLTGNIEWGVAAPSLEDLAGLTIWVWPESLWAPISFTQAYLEQQGKGKETWTEWWCSPEAGVYQFIGEDNIYFYGPAEMAMFMGMQGTNPSMYPDTGQLQLPQLIVNKHILFLDKKASSSSAVKPPTARELLEYYTADQLRAHFIGLKLGERNMRFSPKPLNPKAMEKDSDPVLNEGNLLSNAFNRAVRSCFYTAQKYYDSQIPVGNASSDIVIQSRQVILQYEALMHQCKLHAVLQLLDQYIHEINGYWTKNSRTAEEEHNPDLRKQMLIDAFHMVRTVTVLLHPIAPAGTEMVLEYLQMNEAFWDWEHIFEPIYSFMDHPDHHKLKHLEPRVDFFPKHPSQIQRYETKSS